MSVLGRVLRWLISNGYDAISIFDGLRGSTDIEVLQRACNENRILITSDKDFGDMVFRQQMEHRGIILLRLSDEHPTNKIKIVKYILENHSHELQYNFITATEKAIRVISLMH